MGSDAGRSVLRRDDGLSSDVKEMIYITTIVGGTFVIALLAWIIYRVRRRRKAVEKRRMQEELAATTRPRKKPPGFEEPEMAMVINRPQTATSKHLTALPSAASWYEGSTVGPLPSALSERFRRKDAYVKATLGEAYPMHMRKLSVEERSRLLADLGDAIKLPPEAHLREDAILPLDKELPPIHGKRSMSSMDTITELRPHIRDSRPLEIDIPERTEPPDRWSWTNSQAPATPRMYAPTLHSSYSRGSAMRFRMAVNWVKTRGERIVSGEAGEAPTKTILPKPGVLKNQASKPNLAPKKLVKKASTRRTDFPDLEKGAIL